jgi:hypothetical protein
MDVGSSWPWHARAIARSSSKEGTELRCEDPGIWFSTERHSQSRARGDLNAASPSVSTWFHVFTLCRDRGPISLMAISIVADGERATPHGQKRSGVPQREMQLLKQRAQNEPVHRTARTGSILNFNLCEAVHIRMA